MRFKIVGVLFLLAALVFATDALRHAWKSRDSSVKAISYAIIAVFLVSTVRVFQAEKHRRDDEARERRRIEEMERVVRHAAIED